MSDEKRYTERDVVLAQRGAFLVGAEWQHKWKHGCVTFSGGNAMQAAKGRYSLPMVTRPRVVADPHDREFLWKVSGLGGLVARHRSGTLAGWFVPAECGAEGGGGFTPTPQRVKLWADLLANPTELVEDGTPETSDLRAASEGKA